MWEQDYLSEFTRIKHLGDIEDYNSKFKVLTTRVDDICDENLLEAYMDGLKKYIKHDIFLTHTSVRRLDRKTNSKLGSQRYVTYNRHNFRLEELFLVIKKL